MMLIFGAIFVVYFVIAIVSAAFNYAENLKDGDQSLGCGAIWPILLLRTIVRGIRKEWRNG